MNTLQFKKWQMRIPSYNKLTILVTALCIYLFTPVISEAQTKVLFIGNSFSMNYGGLDVRVKALADQAGLDVETDGNYSGGRTLAVAFADPAVIQQINSGNWDYVVLQEQSNRPITNTEGFHQSVRDFNQVIRGAGAQPVLFMTWCYEGDESMTLPLAQAYVDIAHEIGAKVAPVGIAWQYILDHSNMDMYDDGKHPTANGVYLSACVHLAAVFGENPEGNPFIQPNVSQSDGAFIQQVAADVVINRTIAVPEPGSGEADSFYTLTTSQIGQGRVVLDPGGSQFEGGVNLTATARPADGWQFAGWSGAAYGSENPLYFTMPSADSTLTAAFKEIPSYPDTSDPDATYQAEVYTAGSGCTLRSDIPGYTGTGFVDFGGNGSWMEWSNVGGNGEAAALALRYANGSDVNRQCALIVNGTKVTDLAMAPVAQNDWTQFAVLETEVKLNPGMNIVRLQVNTSSGGPNLDKLEVSTQAGQSSSVDPGTTAPDPVDPDPDPAPANPGCGIFESEVPGCAAAAGVDPDPIDP